MPIRHRASVGQGWSLGQRVTSRVLYCVGPRAFLWEVPLAMRATGHCVLGTATLSPACPPGWE